MEPAELFVTYIQPWLPTKVLLFLVRWYMRLFVGWRMRCGDVVVKQIECDRSVRAAKPVTTEWTL